MENFKHNQRDLYNQFPCTHLPAPAPQLSTLAKLVLSIALKAFFLRYLKASLSLYTDCPWLNDGLTCKFLTLQWCKSATESVESIHQIWNLDIFPGRRYEVDTLLWRGAAWVAAPSRPCDQRVNNWSIYNILCAYNHAGFHFQYSVQYITWDIQYLTIK